MSDEIKERLQTMGAQCLGAYEAWAGNEKDDKARETLQEAVHELRKVMSRLEIELAISERDQMGQKKLPIPPHRASRKKGQDDAEQPGDNAGNVEQEEKSGPKKEVKVQRRSRSGGGRKSAGGNS